MNYDSRQEINGRCHESANMKFLDSRDGFCLDAVRAGAYRPDLIVSPDSLNNLNRRSGEGALKPLARHPAIWDDGRASIWSGGGVITRLPAKQCRCEFDSHPDLHLFRDMSAEIIDLKKRRRKRGIVQPMQGARAYARGEIALPTTEYVTLPDGRTVRKTTIKFRE